MTQKEAKNLDLLIESLKSYPQATQYDKGEPILKANSIQIIKTYIKGLIQ